MIFKTAAILAVGRICRDNHEHLEGVMCLVHRCLKIKDKAPFQQCYTAITMFVHKPGV